MQDSKKKIILDAAVSVLTEKGAAHTSMNDIIRASGVSKGGVYHYFSSKDELLVGVIENFQEEHINYVELFPDDNLSAYEKMKFLISGHKELLDQMGKHNLLFLDLFAQSARIPRLKETFNKSYTYFHGLISALVGQGIQDRVFKDETDPASFASGLIGIFDGIGAGYMVAPEAVSYPDHAVNAALYMLEGIRST